MKQACRAEGIATPAYAFARDEAEAERAGQRLRFPLFVKHPSSYASVSLSRASRVRTPAGLRRQVRKIVSRHGAALIEEMVYDDAGQPLSSTLLDYHVPVTASIPDIRVAHMETPSPYTPGGMKGMGEGGTNGAYAAVVNAVIAALPGADWSELRTPLTPARIWEAIRAGTAG